MSQDDKAVVDAFVVFRSGRDLPGLVVETWPDAANRNSEDIDALAGSLAIEHTSIDTVADQRRDGAWFADLVEPLGQRLASRLSSRLRITFPYRGLGRGQDWAAMQAALETWILTEAPSLSDGRHSIQLESFPFVVDVTKASDRQPGVFFRRYAPEESSLADRLRSQIERKATKLARYSACGKRTVLLLESSDIALMNEIKLVDALRLAFPDGLPSEVQELWYADTSIEGDPLFYEFTAAIGLNGREDR